MNERKHRPAGNEECQRRNKPSKPRVTMLRSTANPWGKSQRHGSVFGRWKWFVATRVPVCLLGLVPVYPVVFGLVCLCRWLCRSICCSLFSFFCWGEGGSRLCEWWVVAPCFSPPPPPPPPPSRPGIQVSHPSGGLSPLTLQLRANFSLCQVFCVCQWLVSVLG